MQRIIALLLAFKEYVALILLLVVSLVLLASNDNTQVRAIRSVAVGFVGVLQDGVSFIPNVINLRRENAVLRQMNVNLSDEVNRLRGARLENLRLRSLLGLKERSLFRFVAADVIGKNLHLMHNTITVNAGEDDGLRPEMPILAPAGLVGKIVAVSRHYALGQIMFNKEFRASAKIQRSRIDGIIAWSGEEHLRLKNVAKTEDVREGDIVTTSEYSNIFPPDIRIGVVVKVSEKPGSLFREIEVAPDVDFASLEQVFVVTTPSDQERAELENRIPKTK